MPKQEVANWGNYPKIEAEVKSSSSLDYLKNTLSTSDKIIARGNGRCYGDAALEDIIFSTLEWKHFLSFDEQNGVLECESGVLLSDILEYIVPKGYFLPVTPGTQYITLGGAIASDVHGKNHHKDGCFSNFVEEFTLLRNSGESIVCSPERHSDIFWATIGGMGLTGIILSAKFRLLPIESSYIKMESLRCENLEETYLAIEDSLDWTYTVAWLDCFQKGKNVGRGILMRGEHAKLEELPTNLRKNPLQNKQAKKLKIPFYFPDFVLRKWSMKIFNFLYYNKQVPKKLNRIIGYQPFFYPLDSILEWNKIYGKSGFIQYQFVLPKEAGIQGMKEVLEVISASGNGSFLVVLKLFGKNNPNAYNSFPEEGYTLALDFKINEKLPALVEELDSIVEKYGGRIYRAKDAMSKASLTDYLQNVESETFNSMQNERIKSKDVKN